MKSALAVSPLFIVSAAILTVVQAPLAWGALAWVSMVPFILACSPKRESRPLALAAYLVCLCYWLGNLYWIAPITIAGWVTFCLYSGLLWPVLALCLRFCRAKKVPLFLAAAVLIVGIERMQGLFLGRFPWRLLGHSQFRNITIIQIADIFGAGGVSFLIAMVNGLIAELLIAWRSRRLLTRGNLAKTAVVSAAIVGAVLYGRWRISQSDKFITDGPVVAALQSNVPQSLKQSFAMSQDIFDDLMQQSKMSAEANPDLIIWPETMVQASLNPKIQRLFAEDDQRKIFDRDLRLHARDTAYLLIGAYAGTPNEAETELIESFNSAFLYEPDGSQFEKRYDKIHLVPFGEVLPFRKTLPWLYSLLKKFTPKELNYDYSLDYGSEYTVFEMISGPAEDRRPYKFGVLICYEDVVPYIARRFALDENGRKRLDWLVNISNDGWFVSFDNKAGVVRPSTELAQHAAACVFRAVENRLCIVRSVNTGISCLIDTLGNIRDSFMVGTLPVEAMTRTGMAGWFTDKMPIDRRVTFFSKYGQWLDFCCEGCVFLFIILPLLARLLRVNRYGTGLSGMSDGKNAQ